MNKLIQKISRILKEPKILWDYVLWKIKGMFLWDYHYNSLRDPKIKASGWTNPNIEKIIDELIVHDFKLKYFELDISDYQDYLLKSEYDKYDYYGGGKRVNFVEKSLEHYLAAKLLDINNNDVYIDIASEDSPTVEIYKQLYKCESYRQDLIFKEGIHKNTIGGDACNLPVEDSFASKMALHCSFEHFEQDSDIRFIIETNRVLRKGGKLCIVPLYFNNEYTILTDPAAIPKQGIMFDPDAILHCVKNWGVRFGRHYDVPHLKSRIMNNLNQLDLTIYVVQNEKKVDPSCYVKFIALFEKK